MPEQKSKRHGVRYEDAKTHILFTKIEDGQTEVWSITELDRLLKEGVMRHSLTFMMAPIDKDWAEWCKVYRGVERHRVEKLTPDALKTPMYGWVIRGNELLLLDGHHRYVYAAEHGIEELPLIIIPDELERMIKVYGHPDADEKKLLTSWSGL